MFDQDNRWKPKPPTKEPLLLTALAVGWLVAPYVLAGYVMWEVLESIAEGIAKATGKIIVQETFPY